jgi:tRNA A37 methylthiotransferase MiaB
MDNQIPALVKKERHQILTDIVKLKRVEFLRNQVNKKRVAVILNSNTKSESNGLIGKLKNPGQKYSILTDNYLKLDLITHHKNLSPGNELMIKINSFDDNFYAVPDSL